MLISIVVPCFNEQENLKTFFDTLNSELELCKKKFEHTEFEVIFVDDGSTDQTKQVIENIQKNNPELVGFIEFSRNFGKEAALTAGIKNARGEILIPIDADLQHPPAVIKQLIERYNRGGEEMVIAKRANRETDFALYKKCASLFYKIQNQLTDVNVPDGAGDFRLISKKVADSLSSLPENRRFMKGLFAWVGFPYDYIEFEVAKRFSGKSHFTLRKLISLAVTGLLDFSAAPLRLSFFVGLTVSLCSFLYGFYILFKTLIFGIETPGYASLIVVLLFIGGLILFSLGIVGEYIWRIYMEVKRRPAFIIEKKVDAKNTH